jgi:Skp family chaperone for outer membrane proteins
VHVVPRSISQALTSTRRRPQVRITLEAEKSQIQEEYEAALAAATAEVEALRKSQTETAAALEGRDVALQAELQRTAQLHELSENAFAQMEKYKARLLLPVTSVRGCFGLANL